MSPLAELQERLTLYKAEERRILSDGQSYTAGSAAGDRQNARASLAQIQNMIRELEQQIAMHPENAGGRLSHSQAIFGGRR